MCADGETASARRGQRVGPPNHSRIETENLIRQAAEVRHLIDSDLELTPALIRHLHQLVMNGILTDAGQFRSVEVTITGVEHVPPLAIDVPGLVRDLCDTVNAVRGPASALKLAALTLWRIGWIHPFRDGNGRTARAVSYLILCSRVGRNLPGVLTIPEQLDRRRTECIRAFQTIDEAWEAGRLDLDVLTAMLRAMMRVQIRSAG